jgi:crotonobetainyl-CoA:carnitine CoA-transferase CaiB-like acyl-CoA transferase
MSTPEGQELIRELARHSDVVVENFKTGGLKRYGLDYDSLVAINPRLIYCSVTGFGHTSPYAARPGYDLLIQAMSGLMSITGHSDAEPGGGPMKVGVAVLDLFTGMYATTAVLGAGFLNAGDVPRRQGNIHPSVVPYQDFPTTDGNMLLAIGNDGQFARFCDAAGVAWARGVRYATNTGRVNNRKTLIAMLMELMRTRTTAEWVALLEANSVPCGPINNIGQAYADPHVQSRGLRVEQERYPGAMPPPEQSVNKVVTAASPLRLSKTPPTLRYAPPALGQHTEEVLCDYLKLEPQQLEALRARGVV